MSQSPITAPPSRGTVDEISEGKALRVTREWSAYFDRVFAICFALSQSGTSAQRPTKGLWKGRRFWDETLGLPIYWNGSAWRRADGTAA